jgi:N-acylneuraminate cytidylyltransferase
MSGELGLCVIPARGGSKRIEKKNSRLFLGKPIIAYSISAALECGCFEEVMVSTDDPGIAELGRKYGASVPFMRSEGTSGDSSGLAAVLLEVLRQYASRGRTFSIAACVLATAPLLASSDLKAAVARMADSRYDAILSVCRYSYPIQRSLVERAGGLRMKWPRYYPKRSQDLQPCFHDAGQFYIVRPGPFQRQRRLFLRRLLKHELPESRVQDIDTEEDWKMAEYKYRFLHG